MIVVSDSSALVCLVRIGHGDVLPTLFKQVVIPPEVASELASLRWPQSVQDFIAAPPSWLEIRTPTSVEPIPNLHAGEAAAISLAQGGVRRGLKKNVVPAQISRALRVSCSK